MSIPAGKYTLGWENCQRAQSETEGRMSVYDSPFVPLLVYKKNKSLEALVVVTYFQVSVYDCILPIVHDSASAQNYSS